MYGFYLYFVIVAKFKWELQRLYILFYDIISLLGKINVKKSDSGNLLLTIFD